MHTQAMDGPPHTIVMKGDVYGKKQHLLRLALIGIHYEILPGGRGFFYGSEGRQKRSAAMSKMTCE